MDPREIKLRAASRQDLDAINDVIRQAVMGWALPERVKRLSLPSYLYRDHDLDAMELMVAEDATGIVGVGAWETADPAAAPAGEDGLLLHGLYVTPGRQGEGIGSRLLQAAIDAARNQGRDGVLVKAQADAREFFVRRGLEQMNPEDPERQYAHRFWKPLRVEPGTGRPES